MAGKSKHAGGTKQISLRVPLDLLKRVDAKARRKKSPRAEIIVDTLQDGLPARPAPKAPDSSVFE